MTKSRVIASYIFVTCSFIILLLRFAYLQLIDHTFLLQQSVNNYSSIVSTLPVRGTIIDKNGIILADNKVSYLVAALPRDLKNSEDLFNKLTQYFIFSEFDKKKYLTMLKNSKKYDWVIIKDDLSDLEIANLTAHIYEFPQISVFAHIKRYYPFEDLYSHSIGYVGRISNLDKKKLDSSGKLNEYVMSDYIGKNGLEQFYEEVLRGQLGKKIIKTDALGNEVGLIANTQAVDGKTLQLTLDNKLQQLAWDLLGDRKGAIVALDPQTGGVLAFVSKPGFDPNWFIDGISLDDWDELTQDLRNPLLNRAAQGSYPPGSTFKPFMALSALYLNIRKPETPYNDRGVYVIPGSWHEFRDMTHPKGLGIIDMYKAITVSSDTYFYKLGVDMGIDKIDKVMPYFGFGKKTGIDLPQENLGLLPSRAWKAKRFAKDSYQKNWQVADSVTIAIGQGFNHYTPLQMAFATSIIANEGKAIRPHFLDKVIDKNGIVLSTYIAESEIIPIPKKEINFIKSAMENVVENGTAQSIGRNLEYSMAGKTGTAQVVALGKNSHAAKFSGDKYKDHSWFIAFAPVDNPKIAIAIIVENAGFGITVAAPIARKLFDQYILSSKNNAIKNSNTDIDDNNVNDTEEDKEGDTDETSSNSL